jgi:hypothetical protein
MPFDLSADIPEASDYRSLRGARRADDRTGSFKDDYLVRIPRCGVARTARLSCTVPSACAPTRIRSGATGARRYPPATDLMRALDATIDRWRREPAQQSRRPLTCGFVVLWSLGESNP